MKNISQFVWIVLFQFVTISQAHSNEEILYSAHWGALVLDINTGATLYAHEAHKLFIPASVTKLFTTVAAVEALGSTYLFKTSVKTQAEVDQNGYLKGNLVLVGGADPLLNSADLKMLAHKVYESGIKVVEGDLLIDDSLLKGTSLPIHSEWEDLPTDYCPELNALSLNQNNFKLTISPAQQIGEYATIYVQDDISFCHINNHMLTVDKDIKYRCSGNRGFCDNQIEIIGQIPINSSAKTIEIAIHNPHIYAKELFKSFLIKLGVTFLKQISIQQSEEKEIASISRPLSQIVYKTNKMSDNLSADLIFKYLQTKSISTTSECTLFDGSGLSRHNLVSPQQVVKLLCELKGPSLNTITASLAIGGVDGTLENRFKNSPKYTIQAKTGSMSGMSNLAGFVTSTEGKKYVFAIFINNAPYSEELLEEVIDNLLLNILSKI